MNITIKKKARLVISSALCLLLSLPLLCTGCGNSNSKVSKSNFYFDTIITITLYGTNDTKPIDHCFELAQKYENLLSNTVAESEISQINNNPGQRVNVSTETLEILEMALGFCQATKGEFDITLGKISDLWDFSEIAANTTTKDNEVDASAIPDASLIEAYRKEVDFQKIDIDQENGTVCLLDDSVKIDLGAIAKGYIADKMKEYLNEEANIEAGTINLGGNVLTIGPKDDNKKYNIGIQKPFADNGEAYIKVMVKDASVVTSGIYQRYFTVDHKLYHHILNKDTGYPVENNLYSVTIISENSTDGDALSTSCFIYGLEKGMAFIEDMDKIDAIFITNDYSIYTTSGLKEGIDYSLVE